MFLTDGNEGFGDIDHLLNDEDNKKVSIGISLFWWEILRSFDGIK